MHPSLTRGAAVLGAGLMLAGVSAPAAPAKTPPPKLEGARDIAAAKDVVPGELIVRFTPGAERTQARRAEGAKLKKALPGVDGLELLRIDKGRSPDAAARAFERRSDVLYAEPNFVRRGQATTNDSRFAEYWGLHNTGQAVRGTAGLADADMDVPEAWNIVQSSPNVVVGVMDSGIAYDHPDLAPNMWANPGEACTTALPNRCKDGVDNDNNGYKDDVRGIDAINGDSDPRDDHYHGSHVAGTIGARGNNDAAGAGTTDGTGVTTQVKLQAIKVLDHTNSGTTASLLEGYAYARRNGAKVVNVSIGGGQFSQAESDAIKAASTVLFVVSAGNDGADNDATPQYPCNYSQPANIVCVAATDQRDQFASFSNYGAASVDLAAPGQTILSTVPALRTVFSDDFETDPIATGRWTRGGTPNTWGWTDKVYGGESGHSLTDSPDAAYAANQDNWARRTAAVNLTGLPACSLNYLALIDAETGYDGFLVETTRNLAGPWTVIGVYTGQGNGRLSDALGSVAGQPGVYVRFSFVSDESEQWDGIYIDDLALKCVGTAYAATDFGFLSGTSMAAPGVSGVAALMFARFPTLTTAAARTKLLQSVDVKAALNQPGKKVATGGRLNAYKALAESTAAVASGVLTVTAGPGTVNNLAVTRFTDTDGVAKYRIADPYGTAGSTGSRVVPGAGCVADGVGTGRVKCAASTITSIRVLAGDQNDTVSAGTLSVPVTVDGGLGNDTITTGTGRDTLTGGAGADRFTAGGGNDTINARDEVADTAFACGESTGDSDTVNADLQPNDPVTAATTNCEVVNKQ